MSEYLDLAHDWGLEFVHFNGMSGELYFVEMMGAGAALVDYDRDGDLDAYLVQGNMLGLGKTVDEATFPPRHPLPLTDRLYRNDLGAEADGRSRVRFVDVTASTGLEALGYGMGVASGDIDNDGWPDLYVTNFGSNQMLRNNGDGTFSDVTAASGTDDDRWSVPAAFLDFDRDGWLDLFVGNYVDYRLATDKECVSESGIRDYCSPLAYQPARDRLFRNRGDGTFEDVSRASGIGAEAGNALGVAISDFDDDGWSDIYVANDQVPNFLWMNQGDGTFVDNAVLAGSAVNEKGQPEASMGVVAGDLNGDGRDDLFMTHLTRETNTLFLNEGGGLFVDATRRSGAGMPSWRFTGFGAALVDFDKDGSLDLFVANGAVRRIEELIQRDDPYPLHQENQLFRNRGSGEFIEVSEAAGAVFVLSEVSRGVAVGDVDNDGDSDLLVTNNAGPARLLVSEGSESLPWLGLRLLTRKGGRDAFGARSVLYRAGGPALWRRLSSDGSYASSHDPRILAGIGLGNRLERVEILWPEGGKSSYRASPGDRYLTFAEDRSGRYP